MSNPPYSLPVVARRPQQIRARDYPAGESSGASLLPTLSAPAPGPWRGRVGASVGWGVEDAALTLEGDGKKAGGEDGVDPTTGKQI